MTYVYSSLLFVVNEKRFSSFTHCSMIFISTNSGSDDQDLFEIDLDKFKTRIQIPNSHFPFHFSVWSSSMSYDHCMQLAPFDKALVGLRFLLMVRFPENKESQQKTRNYPNNIKKILARS